MLKLKNKIFRGDAQRVLGRFPVESVDCVMTSPPYWALRDYGTAKWKGGKKNCDHIVGRNSRGGLSDFQKHNEGSFGDEAIRSGHTCPKCGALRIDNQLGMEKTIEEYIENLCCIFDYVHTALKPTGTCWVNIGDTYYGGGRNEGNKSGHIYKQHTQPGSFVHPQWGDELPERCMCLIPQRFVVEMVRRGWILRNTIIWHKPNVMPSSAKNRFTVDFEYLYFFVKNKKYYFEQQTEEFQSNQYDRARMATARTEDGGRWAQESGGAIKQQRAFVAGGQKGRNMRTVWSLCTKPFGGEHFATYPVELCLTPIRAGCPAGGLVFDPFMGAGTTAVAAKALGRNYVGIELSPKYIKIAKERLAQRNLNL